MCIRDRVKLVQPIGNFPQMADWINEQEGLYTLLSLIHIYRADVVIAIGYDIVECATAKWVAR